VTDLDTFNHLAYGAIATVSPPAGQQGVLATVSGVRLFGGGSEVVSVTLAGVEVLEFISGDDTSGVIRADISASGQGNVVLISNSGSVV